MSRLTTLVNKLDKLQDQYNQQVSTLLENTIKPLVIKECLKKNLYFRSGNGGWACFNKSDKTLGNFSKPLETLLNYVPDTMPYNDIGSLLKDYGEPNVQN